MGVSRDTFYRYRDAHEQGGVQALLESSRRKPNPKNRVEEAVVAAVVPLTLCGKAESVSSLTVHAIQSSFEAPFIHSAEFGYIW